VAPREKGPHQPLARGKLYNRVRNITSTLIRDKVDAPRRLRREKDQVLTEVQGNYVAIVLPQ